MGRTIVDIDKEMKMKISTIEDLESKYLITLRLFIIDSNKLIVYFVTNVLLYSNRDKGRGVVFSRQSCCW